MDLLYTSYECNVAERGRKFIDKQEITDAIAKISVWLTQDKKPSLLLYGKWGTAKTSLARAILRLILTLYPNLNPIYLKAADIVEIYAKSPEEFKSFKAESMLFIDELGREPMEVNTYGNRRTPIMELLEYRYDKQLFTVIASNATNEELISIYSGHIYDRFVETFDMLNFDFKSFRKC